MATWARRPDLGFGRTEAWDAEQTSCRAVRSGGLLPRCEEQDHLFQFPCPGHTREAIDVVGGDKPTTCTDAMFDGVVRRTPMDRLTPRERTVLAFRECADFYVEVHGPQSSQAGVTLKPEPRSGDDAGRYDTQERHQNGGREGGAGRGKAAGRVVAPRQYDRRDDAAVPGCLRLRSRRGSAA